jgi:guanylate kinase
MDNKEHVLICIMGESSCGKDSLVSKLCERTGHTAICSYTTRPRRDGEGDTHIFVDDTLYEEMLLENKIAAFTEISGYKYWTTTDQLYRNTYYIIDPIGVKVLKSLDLPNIRFVTIYINVPESLRKERAMKRGDRPDVYRKRCLSEREQFRQMKKDMDVDYVVSNVDFAKAYSIVKWIATAEGVWKNHTEDTTE